MTEHPGAGPAGSEPAGADRPTFPSYEEFASDLLEAVDAAGLSIEDVRHHLEPGLGERRFECTVRLTGDPPPRYHVHVSYTWDALLTFISAYGPGADCELYHDDDEAQDCPHQQITPQAFVDVEAEFVLGDGGYELHDLDEVGGWVEIVQTLLGKAFSDDDKPSVCRSKATLPQRGVKPAASRSCCSNGRCASSGCGTVRSGSCTSISPSAP